jgi:hypothetical protein
MKYRRGWELSCLINVLIPFETKFVRSILWKVMYILQIYVNLPPWQSTFNPEEITLEESIQPPPVQTARHNSTHISFNFHNSLFPLPQSWQFKWNRDKDDKYRQNNRHDEGCSQRRSVGIDHLLPVPWF